MRVYIGKTRQRAHRRGRARADKGSKRDGRSLEGVKRFFPTASHVPCCQEGELLTSLTSLRNSCNKAFFLIFKSYSQCTMSLINRVWCITIHNYWSSIVLTYSISIDMIISDINNIISCTIYNNHGLSEIHSDRAMCIAEVWWCKTECGSLILFNCEQ